MSIAGSIFRLVPVSQIDEPLTIGAVAEGERLLVNLVDVGVPFGRELEGPQPVVRAGRVVADPGEVADVRAPDAKLSNERDCVGQLPGPVAAADGPERDPLAGQERADVVVVPVADLAARRAAVVVRAHAVAGDRDLVDGVPQAYAAGEVVVGEGHDVDPVGLRRPEETARARAPERGVRHAVALAHDDALLVVVLVGHRDDDVIAVRLQLQPVELQRFAEQRDRLVSEGRASPRPC